MTLEALRPHRSTLASLLRRFLWWTVKLAAGAAFCVGSARWGAAVQSRRSEAIERRPVTRSAPAPRGRGELWLRCPASTTWYNYVGDEREWVAATAPEGER